MNETILNGKSMDIVTDNIQKLKEIFPDVFTEEKVDFEKLEALLGNYIEKDNERYNFTWHGKSQALRLAQTPSTGTLRPCKEESKDWDTTQNLYIEGDNLEVLKCLQKSYHERIKIIYIDPPYNTGNDFVYPDDYKDNLSNYLKITKQVDEEGNRITTNSDANGRYHTNWLNMIYPRLKLARNLLHKEGYIFISIDNNELHNLKKVCDEVFGEENYRNTIIIKRGAKSVQAQFDTWDKLGNGYESILMYSKTPEHRFNKKEKELEENKESSWNNHWRGTDRPTMRYDLFGIKPTEGQWRWGEERSKQAIENYNNMLNDLNKSSDNITQSEIDKWYSEKSKNSSDKIDLLRMSKTGKPEHYIPSSGTQLLNDVWFDVPPNSSTMLKSLFGKGVFESPKPILLLERIIQFMKEDDIILDFFSGSATTAQAVMNTNTYDSGKRKYILVQFPESTDLKSEAYKAGYRNICEIGKERIRRAGTKIKEELPEKTCDTGFKVFKLDSSNIKKWNPDYDNIEQTLYDHISNFIEDRTELDVVFEIMLKYGIDLTMPIEEYNLAGKKVYSIGFGALMICLGQNIDLEIAHEITKLRDELQPEVCRVVFKDNGFRNDDIKTNVKENLKVNHFDEIVSI